MVPFKGAFDRSFYSIAMILPGCLEESVLIEEGEDWDSDFYLMNRYRHMKIPETSL